MILLVELLVLCLPLTALSVLVGGHAIEPSWVVAAALAVVYVLDRLHRPAGRPPRGSDWAPAIVLFVGVGAFALLWSPYGTGGSVRKGMIQIVGILSALGAALAVARCVEWRPALFTRFVRLLVVVLVWVSVIGLAQFVLLNVLRVPELGEFHFFEVLTGNPHAWRYPGQIGGVVRVNSIALEPAHLAQYLACVSGLAWLRVGVFGRAWSGSVRGFISKREAWLVLACAAMTMSLVGYASFLAALVALYVLQHRLTLRRALPAAVLLLAAATAGLWWMGRTERALGTKLATLPTLLASVGDIGDTVESEAISAIAVVGNRVVTASNLARRPLVGVGFGAHPESFVRVAPQWEGISERLNAQDASGLLLRLLSETGLVGSALFVGVWFLVLSRVRRRILDPCRPQRAAGEAREASRGALLGLGAGCAAVAAAYLARMGVYYAPGLWLPFALASAGAWLPDLARDHEGGAEFPDGADARG